MNTMEQPTTLLDVHQVSQRLGVRLHRAYELIRTGVIPAVRIGRQVRVDPVTLEEWIGSGGSGYDGSGTGADQ